MKRITIALIVIAAVFAGCGKETEQSLWKKMEASEANKNADSTVQVCQTLLKDFPDGKLAPGALYKIAETYYHGKHEARTATGYYRAFIAKYPDLAQTPVAMFLLGFIYNNEIRNSDSARIGYEQFLAKYPQHDLAQSARFELANIGKTADQILDDKTIMAEKKK